MSSHPDNDISRSGNPSTSEGSRFEKVLGIFQCYERGELTKLEVLEQMPDIEDAAEELRRIEAERFPQIWLCMDCDQPIQTDGTCSDGCALSGKRDMS